MNSGQINKRLFIRIASRPETSGLDPEEEADQSHRFELAGLVESVAGSG
jgi:hypothetical protein